MTRNLMQSEADKYRRKFWSGAVRHLPHHVVVAAGNILGSDRLAGYAYRDKHLELGGTKLKKYSSNELAEYNNLIRNTELWHGTGRYQYQNGQVVDVLAGIISLRGLRPVLDSYAVMLGGDHMDSVSATKLRIIARSYADTHGAGASEQNRYGSSLWWVSYYYGPFYAKVFTKSAPTIIRNYKKWHTATSDGNGERTWGKKVNMQAKHVWDVFGLGSDIPNNYPILIGIRKPLKTAEVHAAIAEVEVRLTDTVQLESFTHLEVPAKRVFETQSLLTKAKISLPVVAIELGEYAASKQSIGELVGLRNFQ